MLVCGKERLKIPPTPCLLCPTVCHLPLSSSGELLQRTGDIWEPLPDYFFSHRQIPECSSLPPIKTRKAFAATVGREWASVAHLRSKNDAGAGWQEPFSSSGNYYIIARLAESVTCWRSSELLDRYLRARLRRLMCRWISRRAALCMALGAAAVVAVVCWLYSNRARCPQRACLPELTRPGVQDLWGFSFCASVCKPAVCSCVHVTVFCEIKAILLKFRRCTITNCWCLYCFIYEI